ncbi:phage holin family protein [Alkalihalophilus marmarensis]|jgi:toxin secretion/phage lysis holin|uniref:phage holin family protein n=1 Tax=Alkalihalophilus marmarensis TaxID=521377 RepID=UPI0020421249|nr:phage holin family protein [Alkalihalophilus marmarensis]MCM3487910.1 phage holin family protein [Alkalihalophilus marmarensis]
MFDSINVAKASVGFGAGVISFLWGEWSVFLTALIFFVTFDWITGLVAAWRNDELSAVEGFWGIARKFMIFGIVALAFQIDIIYTELAGDPLSIGEFHLSVVGASVLYYLVNELISIAENLGKIGMRLPSPLMKAIKLFDDDDHKGGVA